MATREATSRPWLRHLVLLLGLSALLLVGWALAVTLVPRWWAQFVGDRVDGRMTVGTGWGLSLGFVFTLLPLLVARQAFRDVPWKVRLAALVGAVLLALPNLMTLGIVMGTGSGAHAGERILDVDGPGFRTATAFGAVGAVALFAVAAVWLWLRARDRRRVDTLIARHSED